MMRAALLLVKASLCFHIDKKEGEDKEEEDDNESPCLAFLIK